MLAVMCRNAGGKEKDNSTVKHPSTKAGQGDGKGVRDEVEDRDEKRDGGGGGLISCRCGDYQQGRE